MFEFSNYKSYIIKRLGGERGAHSRLAEAIKCKPAYLSQVLKADGHLSLEQGEAAARYWSLSDLECEFFLLLIQHARSGTISLRKFFEKKIFEMRKKNHQMSSRIVSKDIALTNVQKQKYYSSWHYAAVHIATTLAGGKSPDAISKMLGLSLVKTSRAIEFLIGCKLIISTKDGFESGAEQIHLGHDSEMVNRFHSAWRLKILSMLEERNAEAFHYSSVVTLSKSDIPIVREILMKAVSEVKEIVKSSPGEAMQILTLDWSDLT